MLQDSGRSVNANLKRRQANIPARTTIAALSKAWSVKESTLRSWFRQGLLPGQRIGKLILIDLEKL